MFRVSHIIAVLSFVVLQAAAQSPSVFPPDTGDAAVLHHARALAGRLRILSLALRPGEEDFTTLCYLRLQRGAKVLSAYVTNGECVENDTRCAYPATVAATRRQEAATALDMIGVDAVFLNVPDVASVSTGELWAKWDRDTLMVRLLRTLAQFKPDLVIVPRDRGTGTSPDVMRGLTEVVLDAVRELQAGAAQTPRLSTLGLQPWAVGRVCVDNGSGGAGVPRVNTVPGLKVTADSLLGAMRKTYESIAWRMGLWGKEPAPSYRCVFPPKGQTPRRVDEGLPTPVPATLRKMESDVARFTKGIIDGTKRRPQSLRETVGLLDTVNRAITRADPKALREWRHLMDWKESLEELRTALLGVSVRWQLSESILVERQLTFLTIDTVTGLSPDGTTKVFFPGVEQGWILDEAPGNKSALRLKDPYSLVSPAKVEYDLPAENLVSIRHRLWRPLSVFLIHTSPNRLRNFTRRITLRIKHAPKLTVQLLNPLVRYGSGEPLSVRLMNNSRDGLSDIIYVKDSLCSSDTAAIKLPGKGSEAGARLKLSWPASRPAGTFTVPFEIGGVRIAEFAARGFDAAIDSNRSVRLLTSQEKTCTEAGLQRLGISPKSDFRDEPLAIDALRGLQTVVLDHRVTTFRPLTSAEVQALHEFVTAGGDLVVLSQDPEIWNAAGIWNEVHLVRSSALTEGEGVVVDTTSALVNYPNALREQEFGGWIVQRASALVELVAGDGGKARVVARTASGVPLIVQASKGLGRITYANVALQPQLMNIHPGAHRLLANLVAAGGR